MVGVVQRNQPVYICSGGVPFYISLRALFKALFFCLRGSQSVSKCLFLQSAPPTFNPHTPPTPFGIRPKPPSAEADLLLSSTSRHFNNKLRSSLFTMAIVSFLSVFYISFVGGFPQFNSSLFIALCTNCFVPFFFSDEVF